MSALLIISQVILTLICLMGLVGNFLVLYSLLTTLRTRVKTSPSLVLRVITQTTIADVIFTFSLPLMIPALSSSVFRSGNHWPFGPFMCRYFLGLLYFPQFAKAFLLSVLGVVCYGMHQGNAYALTEQRVSIMFASSWAVSFIISFFVFLYASPDHHSSCNVFWPENVYASDTFVLIYVICVFVLPLLVVFALGKLRHENPFPGEDILLVKNTMNSVFLLIGCHLVLLFPFLIGQLLLNFVKTAPGFLPAWKVNYSIFSGWIWYSSVAVFPYVYTRVSLDMKDAMTDTVDNIGKLRINYSALKPSNVFKQPIIQTV